MNQAASRVTVLLPLGVHLGILGLALLAPSPAWPAKTDTVLLVNGDAVTGEVKSMTRGLLTFSTDSMGKVSVKWEDVRGLRSPSYFEFDLHTGERMYGFLGAEAGLDTLAIKIGNVLRMIPIVNVVNIVPIKHSFWGRIDGSLSLGVSYTKATTLAQLTFDSRTTYTAEKNRFELKLLTIASRQKDKGRTNKVDFGLSYIRLLRKRWLASVTSAAERDDELGINLRLAGGVVGGYYFLQTNHMRLAAAGGVTGNSEYAKGVEEPKLNTELLVELSYALFRYNTPKTDLTVSTTGYANVNVKDRYRVNANIRARHELFKDFFFDLTYYGSLDTKPPSAEGQKTDYGIVSSLGWSY